MRITARITSHHLFHLAFVAFTLFVLSMPDLAWAQASGGLAKATNSMTKIKDWIWLILPIACVIAGALVGAAYSLDMIRKDDLYKWVGGIIFAGAVAGGIIELVF